MPSDWEDEEGLPELRPDPARHRGPTRGQIMRRRLVALASLVVVIVAVVIVLTSAGDDEGDRGDAAASAATGTAPKKAKKAKSDAKPGEVRNATPQADWKPYKGPVPILEYHVLGHPPEGAPF